MVPIKRYIFTLSNVYLLNLLLEADDEEALFFKPRDKGDPHSGVT